MIPGRLGGSCVLRFCGLDKAFGFPQGWPEGQLTPYTVEGRQKQHPFAVGGAGSGWTPPDTAFRKPWILVSPAVNSGY